MTMPLNTSASYRDLRDHTHVKVALYFESLGKFTTSAEVIKTQVTPSSPSKRK